MNYVFKRISLIALLLISTGMAAMETVNAGDVPFNENSRFVIALSGEGTNAEALLKAWKKGTIQGIEPSHVISNRKAAKGLERAKNFNIPTAHIPKMLKETNEEYSQKIIKYFDEDKPALILLAGFMLVLGKNIIEEFKKRILNIHPSILPDHRGKDAIKDAFKEGDEKMGATIHLVDDGVDTGQIIAQRYFNRNQTDTLDSVTKKMHKLEHALYPLVVKYYVETAGNIEKTRELVHDNFKLDDLETFCL